jgi:hypothetical protein
LHDAAHWSTRFLAQRAVWSRKLEFHEASVFSADLHLIEHETIIRIFLEQVKCLHNIRQTFFQVFLASLENRPFPVDVRNDEDFVSGKRLLC